MNNERRFKVGEKVYLESTEKDGVVKKAVLRHEGWKETELYLVEWTINILGWKFNRSAWFINNQLGKIIYE